MIDEAARRNEYGFGDKKDYKTLDYFTMEEFIRMNFGSEKELYAWYIDDNNDLILYDNNSKPDKTKNYIITECEGNPTAPDALIVFLRIFDHRVINYIGTFAHSMGDLIESLKDDFKKRMKLSSENEIQFECFIDNEENYPEKVVNYEIPFSEIAKDKHYIMVTMQLDPLIEQSINSETGTRDPLEMREGTKQKPLKTPTEKQYDTMIPDSPTPNNDLSIESIDIGIDSYDTFITRIYHRVWSCFLYGDGEETDFVFEMPAACYNRNLNKLAESLIGSSCLVFPLEEGNLLEDNESTMNLVKDFIKEGNASSRYFPIYLVPLENDE